MSSADKSRQSSSGKGFFSRSKHKSDKRHTGSEEGRFLAPDYEPSSRSSRHVRESSITSVDRPTTPDASVNSSTGTISAVSYGNTHNDRSPVSVDYLPRPDQMPTRRDQLNRGTADYYQHPGDSNGFSSAGSHLSIQRPPPGSSNITMASTGRQTQFQQWGPQQMSQPSKGYPGGGSSYNERWDSLPGWGQPSFPRTSRQSDQSSVFSGNGQTLNSTANTRSSRTALPSATSQSSVTSSRDSHRLTKFPPSPAQLQPPGTDGFSLIRPDDDRVTEQMFYELMQKRGWHNLPEQARRQMQAYPLSLIHI